MIQDERENLAMAPSVETLMLWYSVMFAYPSPGNMATPAGLEPATTSLEGWCSIQLSYGVEPRRGSAAEDRGSGRETQGPAGTGQRKLSA